MLEDDRVGVGGNSIICQIGWLRERGSFAEILVETWVTSQRNQTNFPSRTFERLKAMRTCSPAGY